MNSFVDDPAMLLGMVAATFTTLSYLPQVIKTWKSKSAGDVSWLMLIALCVGAALWLIYGLMIADTPVMIADTLSLVMLATMLVLKLNYQRHSLRQ